CPGRGGNQLHHLAGLRPHAVGIQLDLRADSQKTKYLICQLADRDTGSGPQVHNLPHSFFGAGSKQESVYRVGDEIQVADRLQAAQSYGSACHRLRHNRRYDRARGLTWTEGVEWPDRNDRQTEGGIEALGDLIGSYLRSRIRGLGLKRVLLVNWNV